VPRTPDLFSGWFDNRQTQRRERWENGKLGPYAHRTAICPHSMHPALRKPWGTNPDLPQNANAPQELRAHG